MKALLLTTLLIVPGLAWGQDKDDAAPAGDFRTFTGKNDLIDTIINTCDEDWLAAGDGDSVEQNPDKTPIFIVGLPRTGTTLTELRTFSITLASSPGSTPYFDKSNSSAIRSRITRLVRI